MCFGGGGSDPYNAYSNDKFSNFETDWNAWAQKDLRAARHGTPFKDLNDYSAFDDTIHTLGQDPQAMMEIREMQRQHAVDLGKVGIDQNFDQFGPKYYKGYRKDYRGYYAPQVEDQYNQTTDKLLGSLADRGMLESSVGNAAQTDLFKKYGEAKTNIANEARDAANKLRSNVEQAKSNLYSLNEASADPMGVNAQAVGQATALVAPPTYSPLGQLFTAALNPFMNYVNAQQNAPTRTYTSPYSSNDGSGKVIY